MVTIIFKYIIVFHFLGISFRCVIAELFCEGNPLFDLSQLLAYKTGDYSPEVKLNKIDSNIKVILRNSDFSRNRKVILIHYTQSW